MASSNRHWPSMFRSKPCNPQHEWQHDINPSILPSSGCHRTPYSSPGCEERTPEPKPRWNPKPEQIRILEAIFDSGMVNPPRDEIKKIRAQLQEYGQVGDANVFYWFQNRKSRSKHKLRNLQNSSKQQKQNTSNGRNVGHSGYASMTSSPSVVVPAHSAPSSSSPSEKSSSPITTQLSNETTALSLGSIINQADYFPITTSATGVHEDQFLAEMPMLFPPQQGFYFSAAPPSAPTISDQTGVVLGQCPTLLLSELLGHEKVQGEGSANMTSLLGYPSLLGGNIADVDSSPAATSVAVATSATLPLPLPGENNHCQDSAGVPEAVDLGALGGGSNKSTVFINDVAFQVSPGPFNVREAFGDDAVLINSAGLLVVTDQWGVTLQSLQNGASYYLI